MGIKKKLYVITGIFIITIIAFITFIYITRPQPVNFYYKVHLNLGKDNGQPIGSLFSIKSNDGKEMAGAGFIDAYSTFIRNNGRILNFYYKSTQNPLIKKLPNPFSDIVHSRLINLGNRLVAFPHPSGSDTNEASKYFDINSERWLNYEDFGSGYFGTQYVNNKKLIFDSYWITYNGQRIFGPTKSSLLGYYVNSTMLVYISGDPGILYTCHWDPYDKDLKINSESCSIYEIPHKDAFPYAFGNLNGEIIFALNNGNIYSLKNGILKAIFERKPKDDSMQIYSIIRYNDILYMGHYPSGSIYQYDGKVFKPSELRIIPMQNSQDRNREVQTLNIYNGDLYAGVWPWGTVWKLDSNTKVWSRVARLFTYPEQNKNMEAPYQDRIRKGKSQIVFNDLGQRVVSLVPFGNSLYASTMNKSGLNRQEFKNLLSEEELSEYGRVTRITNGGNLTCDFKWKDKTELEFIAVNSKLTIYQDNTPLCSTNINNFNDFNLSGLNKGKGVFGSYGGNSISIDIKNISGR